MPEKSWPCPLGLRQTHFQPSGQLLVLNLGRSTCNRPREAFILRLPNELLSLILRFAAETSNSWSRGLAAVAAVAAVCRRFYDIAQAHLYRKMCTNTFHKPLLHLKRIHRSFRDSVSLRAFCRELRVEVLDFRGEERAEAFRLVDDLTSWLTSVERIEIKGEFAGFEEPIWTLIEALPRRIPGLKQLCLSRQAVGIQLGTVFARLDIPSLERLELDGVWISDRGIPHLDPKKHRTAPFTSLLLSDYDESPEATAKLLLWPAKLAEFKVGRFDADTFRMDHPMLHAMLLVHKDTLKSLDIGCLSRWSRGRLFRAADFPHLERLTLSRWSMTASLETPIADAQLILGPSLRRFVWDFTIYDERSETWRDLGGPEAHWMREFVKEAFRQGIRLQTIHIVFDPDNAEGPDDYDFPWDVLEDTVALARSGGVTLTCSQPCLSRKEWLEHLGPESVAESSEPGSDGKDGSDGSGSEKSDDFDYDRPQTPLVNAEGTWEGRDIREYFSTAGSGDECD